MDIEAIKKRIAEIRQLANEILQTEEAQALRGYNCKAFVTYVVEEDDAGYHIVITEAAPAWDSLCQFLAEKLREKGVTEPLEISSEW